MKANKQKSEQLILNQWTRIAIIFVIILLAVISFIMISNGVSNDPSINDVLYSYKIKNDVDYKVYLYENSFYEEEYLKSGRTYPTELINNIVIDFNYKYENSKLMDLVCTYDVKAVLTGNYSDPENNDLIDKSFILKEQVIEEYDNKNIVNIDEQFKIDFPNYKNLIDEFKKQLHLTVSASLDVIMTVNLRNSDGSFNDTKELKLNIPVSDSTIRMKKEVVGEVNKTVINKDNEDSSIDVIKVSIGTILLIVSIVMLMINFKTLFKISQKSQYQIQLYKILKNYGEVIVEVNNKIDTKNIEVLDVKKFEDMIDLEEELKIPILYYEKEQDIEGWFVIKNNNQMFRFILSPDKYKDVKSVDTYKRATKKSTNQKSSKSNTKKDK